MAVTITSELSPAKFHTLKVSPEPFQLLVMGMEHTILTAVSGGPVRAKQDQDVLGFGEYSAGRSNLTALAGETMQAMTRRASATCAMDVLMRRGDMTRRELSLPEAPGLEIWWSYWELLHVRVTAQPRIWFRVSCLFRVCCACQNIRFDLRDEHDVTLAA